MGTRGRGKGEEELWDELAEGAERGKYETGKFEGTTGRGDFVSYECVPGLGCGGLPSFHTVQRTG